MERKERMTEFSRGNFYVMRGISTKAWELITNYRFMTHSKLSHLIWVFLTRLSYSISFALTQRLWIKCRAKAFLQDFIPSGNVGVVGTFWMLRHFWSLFFKYFLTVIFQIFFDRYFSNIFWLLFFKYLMTVIFQTFLSVKMRLCKS